MRLATLAGFFLSLNLSAQPDPGGGSIQGHVLNLLNNAPVRGATVILTGPDVRLVDNADADGEFEFTGLPPGRYKLSASRSGFLDHAARRPVSVSQNERVTTAEIRLPPQGVIRGRVLDENGEPVDRVRVAALKQIYRNGIKRWEPVNTPFFETPDNGEYRFANLKPGRYLIRAVDGRPPVDNHYGNSSKSFYIPVFYPNATDQQQAVPVSVAVGAEVGGIDIHLLKVTQPPAVRVAGKVIGLPPGSQATVLVQLSPLAGPIFGAGFQAGPPGYAFETRLWPGEYIISASVHAGGPAAYGTGNFTVTGATEGAVITMRPAPDVVCRISLAEGGPVDLKEVKMTMAGISSFMATGEFVLTSDAIGRFSALPAVVRRPGHFAIVNFQGLPDGYYVRDVKLGGQEVTPEDFEIQASSELEIVLSKGAGRVAGTVVDADSKPLPGSTVTLIAADAKSRPAKLVADDTGAFQFTNIRPGKYKLFGWEEIDDDLWPDPDFRAKYESRATEITIPPGETQTVQLRVIGADEVK